MRTSGKVMLLPCLLCLLSLLAACAGEPAAGPPPASPAGGLPPLVVTEGSDVKRVAGGAATLVGTVDGFAGVAFSDGPDAVIVEREAVALVRLERGGGSAPIPTRAASSVYLYDIEDVEGVRYLLYGTRQDQPEPGGELVLRNLETARETTIAPAFMIEFATTHASIAGRVIVASAIADLTERFSFYAVDGTPLPDRRNPTDDVPYNMPPLLTRAVLSPDGARLAYLEGPDWDGDRQMTAGTWQLVILDQQDGSERLRLDLFGQDRQASWLDFDGRWAVVSSTTADGTAFPSLVVDTHAPTPTVAEVTAARGIATLA